MHGDVVVDEFSRQAEGFNRSTVANAPELLDYIVQLARPRPGQRWLEAACGPGIVSRRLAPWVAEVHGIDATPAMVQLARAEATRTNLTNLRFDVGDATSLPCPGECFDGALTRFALHHIPVAGRVFDEVARVVRRTGRIVMVDHLGDADRDAFAWSQEIERLRDPSHWATLPLERLRALGSAAGLTLERESIVVMRLDFDDWLMRGSGGFSSRDLVGRLVRERPHGTDCFGFAQVNGRQILVLRVWASAWRKT